MEKKIIENILEYLKNVGSITINQIMIKFGLSYELTKEILKFLVESAVLTEPQKENICSGKSNPNDAFKCKFCPFAKECGKDVYESYFELKI